MYICVCKAITEKQIQEATKSSANVKEVFKKLGVGSECGVCMQDAINHHLSKNQKASTNTSKSK